MFTVTSSDLAYPWGANAASGEDQMERAPLGDEPGTAALRDCMIHLIEEGPRENRHLGGMLRSILPRSAAPIVAHESAETFLDDLDDHAPGVVIVNARIGEAGTMAVLADLRHSAHPFAVILLAPRDNVALAVRAMKGGAADVMTTPCDPHALIASIDAAFAQVRERQRDNGTTMAARALIEGLSRREHSVLRGLIRGWSNKKMAHDLDLSPRTVEIHRANLMQKLGARHLSDVMRLVYAAGMIDRL